MKRYNTQSQKKLKDKRSRLLGEFDKRVPFPERQVYTTTVYPKIERKPDDVFIETRIGDRFDNLAHEFYGDVTMYWIIAKANNLIPEGNNRKAEYHIYGIKYSKEEWNERRKQRTGVPYYKNQSMKNKLSDYRN